jgi:hypothetical protein
LQAGLAMLVGETVAGKEFAMLDQGEQRFRTWANRWLSRQCRKLTRARNLEAAWWHFSTIGMMSRWSGEMAHMFQGVRTEMTWNFEEQMAGASGIGTVEVTGERRVFSPTSRKTPV